jgi:hypothetical protein
VPGVFVAGGSLLKLHINICSIAGGRQFHGEARAPEEPPMMPTQNDHSHPSFDLRHRRLARGASGLLGLAALGLCGCSGADETNTTLGSGRHAISTTVFQADGQTSLLGLVDDPGAPGLFDVATALEIGGSAALFGDDGRNVFSLGSSDSATVTRYELADGQLLERGSFSLQPFGISSAFKRPELVPMISQTKAYWLDDVSAQIVVWNPDAMTVVGTISLAAAQRDGWLLELGQAVLRDGLVFISANYRDDADGEAGEAVAIVVDTASDSVVGVATDTRCGGTLDIARGAGGVLYFASNTFAASLYALGRFVDYPAPCVLRIGSGEQSFDPGYHVSMLDLTGGLAAGQLVIGAGERAFLLALHTDLLGEPITPDTELFALYEAPAWRWWSVDLASGAPAELVEDSPARSASNRVLAAGGIEYIANLDPDAGTSTLMVPQADGQLTSGLEVTGYPYGLIQLR